MDRRTFLQGTGAALSAHALSRDASAQGAGDELDHRNERSDRMPYRRLGRTNFMSSALIFGCGAALAGGKAVRVLEHAFDAGVNYFDVGSNDYYKGAENNLAAFAKAHRGDIWITSKGYARSSVEHTLGEDVSVEYAKTAAAYWLRLIDQSLSDLKTDYIDAYMMQGSNDPSLVRSEEIAAACEQVLKAGKVGHVGLSTHENAEAMLDVAIETDRYSLVMAAVNPAGWYDWKNRVMLEDTPTLKEIRPVLDRTRAANIGVIGMKAGRLIAPKGAAGQGDTSAYDRFYSERLLNADLTPHQRAYAYVVHNGVDAVNADMQNIRHFQENLKAVTQSDAYFA